MVVQDGALLGSSYYDLIRSSVEQGFPPFIQLRLAEVGTEPQDWIECVDTFRTSVGIAIVNNQYWLRRTPASFAAQSSRPAVILWQEAATTPERQDPAPCSANTARPGGESKKARRRRLQQEKTIEAALLAKLAAQDRLRDP